VLTAFIHGFLLAFGLILPLGVQNVFVFNQGATQPRLTRALPAVLTAALCDMLLILLAVLGISLIVLKLAWVKTLLYGAGVVFLLYMGWAIWKSSAGDEQTERPEPLPPGKQAAFALSVSLFNPHAILDTIGVIGTSSLKYDFPEKWAFAASCILVSLLWFCGLAISGRLLGRLDQSGRWLRWLNRLSAVIIWGMAAYLGRQLLS
jgi:L-lysine exporter family protein LysE/ArgO